MMTTAEPEGQFFADIPEDVRNRIAAAGDLQRVLDSLGPRGKDLLPKINPKLTYAEPQNCILHFISPSHPVVPSFATVIGLSLCPSCAISVAEAVVDQAFSAKEFMAEAISGTWIDETPESSAA